MYAQRAHPSHERHEAVEGKTNDPQRPVCCIPESREEDFVERFRRTVSPSIEIDGGHFIDGINTKEQVEDGGDPGEG